MLDAARPTTAAARPRLPERAELASAARRLDWLLLAGVAGLVAYGLWAIGGITRHDVAGNESYYVVRQGVAAALGALGAVALLFVDPALIRRFWRHILGVLLALIGLVYLLGFEARGSRRWIDLGVLQLQPSELGKLLLVLVLAGFLAERSRRIGEWRTVGTAVVLALAPIALVFLQPDFGTALVYGAVLAAALFIAGVRWSQLALLAAVATIAGVALLWLLPSAGVHVLKPYQYARLTAFANPDAASTDATYNQDQSIISVGSGGIEGRGVEGATQTKLDYLPEHATDFVFASLAEQRGFVGASILLLLYLLVLWRGIRIVSIATDPFGAIAAGAIVFALLFQIFVNVGMTMGIAPITGIPLPFVSVGGSSMLTNLLAIGVLESIHLRAVRRSRR
jgi:rod shape determining protein RodA